MHETGTVVEIDGEYATVRLGRQKRCSGCKACVHGADQNELLAVARNGIGAARGDRVEMEAPVVNQVREGFLLFIAPMLLVFLGYSLLTPLLPPLPAFLGGLLAGAIPILVLRLKESRGRYTPVLTRVLEG